VRKNFFNLFLGFIFLITPALLKAEEKKEVSSPKESGPVSVSTSGDRKYEWHKSANADGIVIYWCKMKGDPLVAFKGEGIVDAPLEKVASVIVDTTRGTEWIDGLLESQVLRSLSPTEFIEYDHMGIPFPFTAVISDRDFVSQVRVENNIKSRQLTVSYKSVEDPSMPVLKKYVRGNLIDCVFKMTPMTFPDQTYVEAEFYCDPKGSLAKWLVNFFQESWPQTTFQNLRKEVKKTDIRVLPVIQSLLHSSPGYAGVKISDKN
jgi:hypothetical protein